jgi:hypothetical protein
MKLLKKNKMSPFHHNDLYDADDEEYDIQPIRYFHHETDHEHKEEWPFSPMLTTFMISTLFLIFYSYIVI